MKSKVFSQVLFITVRSSGLRGAVEGGDSFRSSARLLT